MDIQTIEGYVNELKALRHKFSDYDLAEMRMHVSLFDRMASANLQLAATLKEYECLLAGIKVYERIKTYRYRLNDICDTIDTRTNEASLIKLQNIEKEYLMDIECNLITPNADLEHDIDETLSFVRTKLITNLSIGDYIESDGLDWQTRQAIREEEALNDIMADLESTGCEVIITEAGDILVQGPLIEMNGGVNV